jgi:predicted dehydrogenase
MNDTVAGPRGLLIGYGSIGRRHLTNLHALGVTDWAVVRSGAGALPFEPPGPVRTYTDLTAALEAERPTFAVVANPTALHLPTTLACVQQGCAVLVEKPVSHRVDGLVELAREAAAHTAPVLAGFQFRFDPGLRRVAELLAAQAAGAPIHVRASWGEYLPDWHPWEDFRTSYAARRDLGGGVHHTLCHPLDYLAMLFGHPTVEAAFLTEHGPLDLDVAEAADVRLRFDGGVTAEVHLDYWARPTKHEIEVVCTRGTIAWNYLAGELRIWSDDAGEWRSEPVPGIEARDELFAAEARHFLEVAAGRAAPACTLDDGIRVVELCAAIDASSTRARDDLMEAP